jgi:nucleotide-binding universal stress UspA family protein
MASTEGVLFATDFSAQSEWVGAVARDTAHGLGATLHVIHVVPPVTDPGDAAERLARVGSSLANGGSVKTALLNGRVARQIVDYARSAKVRLIVIGTHGRTGVSRALLGSVAEAVVRLAPCPVLTVPPVALPSAATDDVPEAYRCVVCATPADDLICEGCRARIRGEALEHKLGEERAGRRGSQP